MRIWLKRTKDTMRWFFWTQIAPIFKKNWLLIDDWLLVLTINDDTVILSLLSMNIWIVRDRNVSETRNQLTLQKYKLENSYRKKNIKRNKKNTKNKEKIHWTIKMCTCFSFQSCSMIFCTHFLEYNCIFLVEHSHFLSIQIEMMKDGCLFFSRSTCWAVILHGSRGTRTMMSMCNSIFQLSFI